MSQMQRDVTLKIQVFSEDRSWINDTSYIHHGQIDAYQTSKLKTSSMAPYGPYKCKFLWQLGL
jgi:hypothetical protein